MNVNVSVKKMSVLQRINNEMQWEITMRKRDVVEAKTQIVHGGTDISPQCDKGHQQRIYQHRSPDRTTGSSIGLVTGRLVARLGRSISD